MDAVDGGIIPDRHRGTIAHSEQRDGRPVLASSGTVLPPTAFRAPVPVGSAAWCFTVSCKGVDQGKRYVLTARNVYRVRSMGEYE